jgi:hypothetical protein
MVVRVLFLIVYGLNINNMKYFENKSFSVATKHKKEIVFSSVFSQLGLNYVAAPEIDTDILGTFTGEVERKHSPLETALQKAKLLARKINNVDFVLANEGSFGPHPYIPFVASDSEVILMYDVKADKFFYFHNVCAETNFAEKEIASFNQLHEFLKQVKFPSHALIVSAKSNDGKVHYEKAIQDENVLKTTIDKLFATSENGLVKVQTDMRAHLNPTRMNFIAECAQKFVDELKCSCPKCNYPQFKIKRTERGLPCYICNNPTQSIKKYIYECLNCNYTEEKNNEKEFEDPMYCEFCNP